LYRNLKERYAVFETHVQVLNMVSDLQKAKHWQNVQKKTMEKHLYGAMTLLDYMITDPKWLSKCRELLRLREVIGSLLFMPEPYGTLEQTIQSAIQLDTGAYRALNNFDGINTLGEK
jgi:hypothetical protein